MSAQGLEVIDQTVQVTHEWINELAARLDWTSKRNVLRLLRSTLHQIRDHLSPDELAQFSAQLPLLVRGMLFEGWIPKQTPIKERNLSDFAMAIEDGLGDAEDYRGLEDISSVLELINNRLSRGEVEDIRAVLSADIRSVWPKP